MRLPGQPIEFLIATLVAIVTLAGCATCRGSVETRRDPSAGTVTYKGRTIVFDEAADPPLLTIDGKPIKVRRIFASIRCVD